ncbi:RibD family protein [Leptothoe spongobia]|uniref:RibD family protein n=1 Tax=Leptothoe spongobia TAU-MAC 1115 TaxID=1967444 RepID=A0A947DL57_9CYAN|nr:RibD family protein [Leptothoe spongobia]MBT9318015.1 RibD family protein [Leptothoe spongobia TAU-MAC 1115]
MSSPALQSDASLYFRPHVTVVLAMSADGKISDAHRTAARFPSTADKHHLEQRITTVDATLLGADTLRAYGTTALIKDPALLEKRRQQHQCPQPIQIVCSLSGKLDSSMQFFRQPVTRWLLTTTTGAANWKGQAGFERLWIAPTVAPTVEMSHIFDWLQILTELKTFKIHHLLVMGGGRLVATLMAADLIDELWLTICPLIIGGAQAPTPCDGIGFSLANAPRLTLVSSHTIGDEVFLNYQRQR